MKRSQLEKDLNAATVEILRRSGAESTPRKRFQRLKEELKQLPEDFRRPVELLMTSQENLLVDINQPLAVERRDRIGAGICGGVLLLVMLAVAVFIPDPTAFQERTFAIVLAFAAGACGAFLPGTVAVTGKRPSVAVRATGAIGLAVFTLLFYKWIV